MKYPAGVSTFQVFWPIVLPMHEMSVAASLLAMIREEMERHGAQRLLLARVRCGALSNIVPESLEMAFELAVQETDFDGARLEIVKDPLILSCGQCGREFDPAEGGVYLPSQFAPCPFCGHEFTHRVISGKGLYLEHIEAE